MSKKIIGLDIQNHFISAVMVRSGMKGNWIEGGTRIPIPNDQPFHVGMSAALQTLSESMDLSGAVCVASIPADRVSFRNLKLPFKDAKKIRQVLPFELEPMQAIPVDELIIDFFPIKQTNGSSPENQIIAACVEKSFLQSYLDALSAWKISPKMISVSGYASFISLSELADIPEKCLMADINPDTCTITIIISKQVRLIRNFRLAIGNEPMVAALLRGIQHTLSAFDEMFLTDFIPDQILVISCIENDASLEEEIQKATNIPVRRMDLLRELNMFLPVPATVKWMSDQTDRAIGLAAIEIENISALNFRRGPFAIQKQWVEHKSSLIKTGILCVFLMVALIFHLYMDLRSTEIKYQRINQQITAIFKSTFPNVTNIVDPLHQMRVAMDDLKKTMFVPGDTGKNIRSIDIIHHISTSVPKEIQVDLTRLDIGDDSVQIAGITDTFNAVDEIKNKLEQKSIFQKVTIMSATTERGGNRIQFKLKIQL